VVKLIRNSLQKQVQSPLEKPNDINEQTTPVGALQINHHTGIYSRCGGERADSVDEY